MHAMKEGARARAHLCWSLHQGVPRIISIKARPNTSCSPTKCSGMLSHYGPAQGRADIRCGGNCVQPETCPGCAAEPANAADVQYSSTVELTFRYSS